MSVEWMRERGHDVMPPRGALTVTVPGTVGGWTALNERFGTRGLDALLAPAARYARDGAPMPADFVNTTMRLSSVLEANEAAASVFHQVATRAGDRVRQTGLADTLERVGREGQAGFYSGDVADDIVTTLTAHGSPITHADLANYARNGSRPSRQPIAALNSLNYPRTPRVPQHC